MRVMVFSIMPEGSGDPLEPTPEQLAAFAEMDRFIEELTQAGVFIAGAGLKPMSDSKRVVTEGSNRSIIDGPFAEAREMVAGFSIWEVKDMDEAVAWAKRCPMLPGTMEIRPFYEAEDLADFITPEELEMGRRDGDRGKLGVA